MININILNSLIKGVSEQIPLVNSFYTQSPYESWNVKEVMYGSISFVVTKTATREQTTTYDAVLYYADRLTEDHSNRDSIHSDAATVIQTIVGAINQSDDDYITVDYPVSITLFEQSFCDDLCGGYANLIITVEGMGECFNDEFSVPEIIGTSAYYTKEQIVELFPLRTQLSTIAYSGSFRDLLDTPDLVTEIQYNNLVESVSEGLEVLANEVKQKVSVGYFDGWADNVEKQLDDKISKPQFNSFVEGQNAINNTVEDELKNKVSSAYFSTQISNLEQSIDDKVSRQTFDNLSLGLNNVVENLAVELKNKLTSINNAMDEFVTDDDLKDYATQDDLKNFVTDDDLKDYATQEDIENTKLYTDNTVTSQCTQTYNTINEKFNDYYNKEQVDELIENIEVEDSTNVTPDWIVDNPMKDGYIKNRTHYVWNERLNKTVDMTSTRAGETLVGGLGDGMIIHITNTRNTYNDALLCEVHHGDRVVLPVDGPNIEGVFALVDNAIALVQNNAGYGIQNELQFVVYSEIKKLDDFFIGPNIARVEKFADYYNREQIDELIENIEVEGGTNVVPDWNSNRFSDGYIKNRTHYIWNKYVDKIVDVTSTRAGETLVGGLSDGMIMYIDNNQENNMIEPVTCEVHLGNRVTLPLNGPQVIGVFALVDNALALVQNNAGYGIDNVLHFEVYDDIKKLDDFYISPNIARVADMAEQYQPIGDYATEEDIKNTKLYSDNTINEKLNDYYNKEQIDSQIGDIDTILNNILNN